MIQLQGSLVTPLNTAVAPVIKFVSKTNGRALISSEGLVVCGLDGSYSANLVFGEYDIEADFSGVGDYVVLGRDVVIDATTPSPTEIEGIL